MRNKLVALFFTLIWGGLAVSQTDTSNFRKDAVSLIKNYYAQLDNIHSVLNNNLEKKTTTINNILKNIYQSVEIPIYNDIIISNNKSVLKGKEYLDLYNNLYYNESMEHKITFLKGLNLLIHEQPDRYLVKSSFIDSIYLMNFNNKLKTFSRFDTLTVSVVYIKNASNILVPRILEVKKYFKDQLPPSPIIPILEPISATGSTNPINYPPIAKINVIGVQINISQDQMPLTLNSSSTDPENEIMTYRWSIIKGLGGSIESPTSASTKVTDLGTGIYTFKLEIRDSKGLMSSETVDINVITDQPPPLPSPTQPIVPVAQNPKEEKVLPLKGGPEYALMDLVFPGIGHFYSSGDYTGFGKKKYHFLTTIAVGALLASGFYYKLDSEHDYSTYKSLSIEYQKNEFGVLTGGQRGGVETEAQKLYERSKQKDKLFKGLLIAAGCIDVGDAILTLFEGLRNKSEYNRRHKLGNYRVQIKPFTNQYVGTVSLNLNSFRVKNNR